MIKEKTRCDLCINPVGYPEMTFSTYKGRFLCSECLNLVKNPINFHKIKKEWKRLLGSLPQNSLYNALLAYSGGKDSSVALYLAVKKYGLKVLAFTIDHGLKSPQAMENARNITKYLNVDWLIIRHDCTSFFRKCLLRNEVPCEKHCSVLRRRYSEILAKQFNIKLVINGGDVPVNREVIIKPNKDIAIVRLIALERIKEKRIFELLKKLPWKHPQLAGFDTDCLVGGIALERFNKTHDYRYEVEYLSMRVRHGLYSRREALYKLTHPVPIVEEVRKQVRKRIGPLPSLAKNGNL